MADTGEVEEKVIKKDEDTVDVRCPSCTASISFNPKINKWKCAYCGSEFTIEEINQHKNESTKVDATSPPKDEYSKYISYKCESCGAEIIADEQTSATFCVYCGNTAILKSKLSGEFTPSKIIPFKTTKEDAIEAFKGLSKGRPLMPKSFNNQENIDKIKGIYVPFWLYSFNVNGEVSLSGEKISCWSRGRTHYTKTSIYKLIRGGKMNFKDIPVDGSSRFDDSMMNSIEPFDYKDFVPYSHAYLSGFFAEKYDVDGDSLKEDTANRAVTTAIEELKNTATAGYSSVNITSDNLKAKFQEKNYVLLPVWMVNVKYNNEMYLFAMNGQTKEFIGNIPIDKKKTILYSVIIFIISCLAICLLFYIMYA